MKRKYFFFLCTLNIVSKPWLSNCRLLNCAAHMDNFESWTDSQKIMEKVLPQWQTAAVHQCWWVLPQMHISCIPQHTSLRWDTPCHMLNPAGCPREWSEPLHNNSVNINTNVLNLASYASRSSIFKNQKREWNVAKLKKDQCAFHLIL